jgi:hypothetical protein
VVQPRPSSTVVALSPAAARTVALPVPDTASTLGGAALVALVLLGGVATTLGRVVLWDARTRTA